MSHTILDQADEYGEAQRYIFQENRCIPPEIWPGPSGSWNFQNSHPYWSKVQKAKKQWTDMMNSSVMQDSQDPYDTENSQQNSKAGPSLSSYKIRPKWKKHINKRRNKKDHEDWIEQMNITDPDSTPLDTPDEDHISFIDDNEDP